MDKNLIKNGQKFDQKWTNMDKHGQELIDNTDKSGSKVYQIGQKINQFGSNWTKMH